MENPTLNSSTYPHEQQMRIPPPRSLYAHESLINYIRKDVAMDNDQVNQRQLLKDGITTAVTQKRLISTLGAESGCTLHTFSNVG